MNGYVQTFKVKDGDIERCYYDEKLLQKYTAI